MSTPEQTAGLPAAAPERRRVLGLLDITLFTVSAMLVVDTLTVSAAIGTNSIGWWLLCVVFFLVPYGLMASELATTYPEQGGIYVWIKRAMGPRWAARTTYWYWINVALWMPAVFLLFAGVFSQLFASSWTDWENGKWAQVAIAITLTWLVVAVGVARLEVGKRFNNLGAALKVAIIAAIAIGGIVTALRDGAANPIAFGDLVPSFGVATDFLPVIVFMLLGFELVSSMAGEIKDPERQIPRAFLTSGVVVASLYLAATVGILLAVSLEDLSLVGGLVDTFEAIFGTGTAGDIAVYTLGIAALYTFFTNMTTWSMGANRTAAEAAADGELPAALGRLHPTRGTPVVAFVVTGIVSTTVLLVAALFVKTQDGLFFALFAASSVVFLLPYLLMFPAATILRMRDPDRRRPFRIPGPTAVVAVLSTVTTLFVAASALLFVWPEVPGTPEDWSYTGPLLGIVAVTLVVGEVVLWRLARRRPPAAGRTPLPGTPEAATELPTTVVAS